ncbi:MAG: hypothetical protein IJ347_09440 [Faecalibacterium sp.]|nr:hypothetical protein [Faecalibacterium sp.]
MHERDLSLGCYEISRERYRELKYFCRQYPEKKRKLADARDLSGQNWDGMPHANTVGDPTARRAEKALRYAHDVELIERVAAQAAPDCTRELLLNVTEGVPWEKLPVYRGKRQFYAIRRRFFWLLDAQKGN